MSGALIDEPFIAVTKTLIGTFGANRAIILQELHYTSLEGYVGGEAGQTRISQTGLGERTGLSRDCVYRGLKSLIADRIISVGTTGGGSGRDQTRSYQIDYDAMGEVIARYRDSHCAPDSPIARNRAMACADPRNDLRDIAQCIEEVEEPLKNPPPTPPVTPRGTASGNDGGEGSEEVRNVVAQAVKVAGIENEREACGPIIAEAMARGLTGQQVYDECKQGFVGARSIPAVLKSRLAKLEPRARRERCEPAFPDPTPMGTDFTGGPDIGPFDSETARTKINEARANLRPAEPVMS